MADPLKLKLRLKADADDMMGELSGKFLKTFDEGIVKSLDKAFVKVGANTKKALKTTLGEISKGIKGDVKAHDVEEFTVEIKSVVKEVGRLQERMSHVREQMIGQPVVFKRELRNQLNELGGYVRKQLESTTEGAAQIVAIGGSANRKQVSDAMRQFGRLQDQTEKMEQEAEKFAERRDVSMRKRMMRSFGKMGSDIRETMRSRVGTALSIGALYEMARVGVMDVIRDHQELALAAMQANASTHALYQNMLGFAQQAMSFDDAREAAANFALTGQRGVEVFRELNTELGQLAYIGTEAGESTAEGLTSIAQASDTALEDIKDFMGALAGIRNISLRNQSMRELVAQAQLMGTQGPQWIGRMASGFAKLDRGLRTLGVSGASIRSIMSDLSSLDIFDPTSAFSQFMLRFGGRRALFQVFEGGPEAAAEAMIRAADQYGDIFRQGTRFEQMLFKRRMGLSDEMMEVVSRLSTANEQQREIFRTETKLQRAVGEERIQLQRQYDEMMANQLGGMRRVRFEIQTLFRSFGEALFEAPTGGKSIIVLLNDLFIGEGPFAQAMRGFNENLSKVMPAIGRSLAFVVQNIPNVLDKGLAALVHLTSPEFLVSLKDMGEKVFEAANVIAGALGSVQKGVDKVGGPGTTMAGIFLAWITGAFGLVRKGFAWLFKRGGKLLLRGITKGLPALFKGVVGKALGVVGFLVSGIFGAMKRGWEAVTKGAEWTDFFRILSHAALGFVEGVIEWVTFIPTKLIDWIFGTDITKSIQEGFDDLHDQIDHFFGLLERMWSAISDWITRQARRFGIDLGPTTEELGRTTLAERKAQEAGAAAAARTRQVARREELRELINTMSTTGGMDRAVLMSMAKEQLAEETKREMAAGYATGGVAESRALSTVIGNIRALQTTGGGSAEFAAALSQVGFKPGGIYTTTAPTVVGGMNLTAYQTFGRGRRMAGRMAAGEIGTQELADYSDAFRQLGMGVSGRTKPLFIPTFGDDLIRGLAAVSMIRPDIINKLSITSAYRSPEEQAQLYRLNPNKAGPPGSSRHEVGLATDIGGLRNLSPEDQHLFLATLAQHGVGPGQVRLDAAFGTATGETWHFERVRGGARATYGAELPIVEPTAPSLAGVRPPTYPTAPTVPIPTAPTVGAAAGGMPPLMGPAAYPGVPAGAAAAMTTGGVTQVHDVEADRLLNIMVRVLHRLEQSNNSLANETARQGLHNRIHEAHNAFKPSDEGV